MVAGKVKKVMGLQKSPATPKLETAPSQRSSSLPSSPLSTGKVTVFSRSVGVYFPRSSAQVQLRSPNIADLFRLIEDLQETESRLRAELLEQKILKETVSIVPFLENEVATKNEDLDRTRKIVEDLEAETRALRIEVEMLHVRVREIEEGARRREKEVEELRRTITEQQSELKRFCENGCSSSQQFQGLIDASAKSILLKNVRKSTKPIDVVSNHEATKLELKDQMREERESEPLYQHNSEMEQILKPRRVPRVPNPPPLASMTSGTRNVGSMLARFPAITMPLPPPPPPPPPPSVGKGRRMGAAAVRRVPEVIEFYHSLMRRDSRRDSGGGVSDAIAATNARKMIGEIENRSAHLHAIKREVETQGDFIRFLIKEVESAAFSDIEDLVAFVKWLDHELSFLVDERAVLKHFDWPEAKSDAMREAAFEYCDFRKLESEAASFSDDPRQPHASALKKMQSLMEKLELAVYNLSRVREVAMERYKNFRIPWEWMLDSGIVSQIKLASVKLAMKYMKRVSFEIDAILGTEDEDLMLRGVRFAFRVHQDYNASIEFYWAPFIVESNSDHAIKHRVQKRMVRLDSISNHSRQWEGVDVLVFESYVWWMYQPLINATIESQEMKEYDVPTAYRIALKTWTDWIEATLNPQTQKAFFMTLSPTHLWSWEWGGGSNGNCHNESYPIKGPFWGGGSSLEIMGAVQDAVSRIKRINVTVLNITQLSEFRKDGHTSVFTERRGKLLTREQRAEPNVYADCIHWCLPGVPDTWNEILYAYLIYQNTD